MCVGGVKCFIHFFSLFHRQPWVNGLFMGGDGGNSAQSYWGGEGCGGEDQ